MSHNLAVKSTRWARSEKNGESDLLSPQHFFRRGQTHMYPAEGDHKREALGMHTVTLHFPSFTFRLETQQLIPGVHGDVVHHGLHARQDHY